MSGAAKPERRSAGTIQKKREQLDWPKDRDLRILSIDGGGIKGIFPAAVLARLEQEYLDGQSISEYFDYICGTSTGGIIALGLGAGLTAQELLDLYLSEGQKIFPAPRLKFLRWFQSLAFAPYDSKILKSVLENKLFDKKFGSSQSRLCIPSFDGKYGEVFVYKTNHHPDYRLDHLQDMVTIGMATSAAPTFLRPHSEGSYHLVDGGVWANNPIMIGLVDALSCYEVSRDRIKILSLGCGSKPYVISPWQKWLSGKLFWWDIIFAAMNLQSQNAIGQAGLLIGRDNIIRVDPDENYGGILMDDYEQASKQLPSHADSKASEYGSAIKSLFLNDKAEHYTPYNT